MAHADHFFRNGALVVVRRNRARHTAPWGSWGKFVATALQGTQPAEVVRAAWARYAAGDVDGAMEFFSPDVVWHTVPGYPGPTAMLSREELRRWALGLSEHFSTYSMSVTDVRDMGQFVLAHGMVYAEQNGDVVVDRVTMWRCRVSDGLITSVDAQEAA